jgi:hypothetical protein
LVTFLALLLVSPPVRAQRVPTGRIEGELRDSVHKRPLADAMIAIARTAPAQPEFYRVLVSDQRGRYHVDSLAAGRYTIWFSHPFLDSLEISFPPRVLELSAGEEARVDFATPSGATLRAGACPGLRLEAGTGALVGRVTDAERERPIPGATVVVSWTDLAVDRATRRPITSERTGAVSVDSGGVYRLCGVPTATSLLVQVQANGRAGSALQTEVPDDAGVTVLGLSFSPAASRALSVRAQASGDSAARSNDATGDVLTGTASLTGTVRGPGGAPLGGVVLRIVDAGGTAHTDSLGRFALGGLPAGSQQLEARRIGYLVGRRTVELRSGTSADMQLRLERIVSLDSIRVVAQRMRYPDFERHKHSGFGRFLSEEQITQRNAFEASDLLRMMPGFRVQGSGLDAKVVSSRGANGCSPNIVIDRIPNQDINLLHPSEIGGMEVYAGQGGPMMYDRGCGVIVIWTKR